MSKNSTLSEEDETFHPSEYNHKTAPQSWYSRHEPTIIKFHCLKESSANIDIHPTLSNPHDALILSKISTYIKEKKSYRWWSPFRYIN